MGGIVTVPGPYGSGDPGWTQPGQPVPPGFGAQGSFIPQQSSVQPGYQQYPPPQPAYPQAGYPQPGYPPVAYPAYGVPVPMPRNGMGTAGLVLGILAVVFCWAYWLGVLLGILAIIFGGVGLARSNSGQATNRGAAMAGLILGIVAIAIFVVLVLLVWQAIVAFT